MSITTRKPSARKSAGKTSTMVVKKSKKPARQVTFGSVTVRAHPIDQKQAQANVASGQLALERLRGQLLTAGVKLSPGKNVPLYHVDPDRPEEIIRRLGGKVERGALVDGEFLVKE